MSYYTKKTPRSQKARGVMGLEVARQHHPGPILLQEENELADLEHWSGWSKKPRDPYTGAILARKKFWFARPCPTDPRHGFVESRPVGSYSELKQVWEETREADPNGEVLLMPFYPAEYSAILTPASVAVGPGHDGATAGVKSIAYPINGADIGWATKYLNKQTDPETGELLPVEKRDVAYIEAVSNESEPGTPAHSSLVRMDVRMVQARSGPPVLGFGNFVPEDTLVRRVLKAEGDSLEWEATLKAAGVLDENGNVVRANDGTVVWAPGHTRTSHYAVHAILNGLPIWFDDRPDVGSWLGKTFEPKRKWHSRQFRRGFGAGMVTPLKTLGERSRAVYVILFALHHATALMLVPHGSHVIGMGCALMIRLGFAAMLGEARHGLIDAARIEDREGNYALILNEPMQSVALRDRIGKAWYLFRECSWGTGGFGGKAWAACADGVIALDTAVRAAMRGKDRGGKHTIEALNVAVNAAHNNGWWMNKFTSKSAFDGMAENNPFTILAGAITAARITARRPVGSPGLIRAFVQAGDISMQPLDFRVVGGRCTHPDAPPRCKNCGGYTTLDELNLEPLEGCPKLKSCECCKSCGETGYYCECDAEEECEVCDELVTECDCPAPGTKEWAHGKACAKINAVAAKYEYDQNCPCHDCATYASEMKTLGHPVAKYDIVPTGSTDPDAWFTYLYHNPSGTHLPSCLDGTWEGNLAPWPKKSEGDAPLLVVTLRSGWMLHFQYGHVHTDSDKSPYKTFDIKLLSSMPIIDGGGLFKALLGWRRIKSLAGSPTRYSVVPSVQALRDLLAGVPNDPVTDLINALDIPQEY